MFLRSWRPVVTSGGEYCRDLFLLLEADLQCPCCRDGFLFKTKEKSFFAGTEFLKNWLIHELLEPKECPNCGVYSGMPQRRIPAFRFAVENKITKEWLETEMKNHNLELFDHSP